GASGSYFLSAVSELFHLLADVIVHDVVIHGFAILLGLNDRVAGSAFVERAHAALGFAADGYILVTGKRAADAKGQNQTREFGDCCERFSHTFPVVGFLV